MCQDISGNVLLNPTARNNAVCIQLVVLQRCSDDPGASSDPGTQLSSDPGTQPSSNLGLAGECSE